MTTQATSVSRPAHHLRGAIPVEDRRDLDRFTEALDAHLMGDRLSTVLGVGRRPCHVLDAKYEPGVQAVVLYQHGVDLVRGDLLASPGMEAAKHVIARPGVGVSVFPSDPGLPTLQRAMDGAVLGPLLAEAMSAQARIHRRALARRCRLRLLRYRPGRRATVRVTTGLPGPSYVAKVYHDPIKAAAVAREAQALAATVTPNGILRFARCVAHAPQLSVVVQQAVHGELLDAIVVGQGSASTAAVSGVHRAAIALAQLHDGPVVSTRQRLVVKELQRFVARAARISTVDAQVGAKLRSLAERLLETHVETTGPVGLVHGDCKPGQFMLADDGGVYLLDLDHCGVGDQAGDVATFAASLRQLAVRRATAGTPPARTANLLALADGFIDTYLRHRGAEADLRTRIRWHEAVALERKALRAFARAPRSPLPTALVEAGHRCLDEVTKGWS